MPHVITSSSPTRVGSTVAPLQFVDRERGPRGEVGGRYLALGGENAFELSFWCGTCPLLFERLEGATETLSAEELQTQFNNGLTDIEATIVETISDLLPEAEYLPLLLEIAPRLVLPMGEGDYFAEEQVQTWGMDAFWGLPRSPRTPYYRAGSHPVAEKTRLFNFVVPMVPPSWNDQQRVAEYADMLAGTSTPTCLALSILDICEPAIETHVPEADRKHWGLVHFLLDGHHKMQAAAQAGSKIRLLTMLSIDGSLAQRADVLSIPGLLNRLA